MKNKRRIKEDELNIKIDNSKNNDIRSEVIDASPILNYEVAKEFYVIESHNNDLYNQN